MRSRCRRERPRRRRRIRCELTIGERVHRPLVLDLSANGLFLRMAANGKKEIERGRLVLQPGRGERIELVVEVVRQFLVPRPLLDVARGGVGVRIVEAPDAYYEFLGRIGVEDPA